MSTQLLNFLHAKQRMRFSRGITITFAMLCSVPSAQAVTLSLGPQGGLMMQPSSQYFHAVYGAFLNLASDKKNLQLQTIYLERPRYKASGFVDQERGGFFLLGTKLAGKSHLQLSAFVGYGKMQGYIQKQASSEKRTFKTAGLASLVELGFSFASAYIACSHGSLIGFDGHDQTSAYVAWPYNFFLFELGTAL